MLKKIILVAAFLSLSAFSVQASDGSSNPWVGFWETADAYGSTFRMEVRADGSAFLNYGDGVEGSWVKEGSGLRIIWASGKKDFLFNGVMGRQRLGSSKDPNMPGTSSFMKKVDSIELE